MPVGGILRFQRSPSGDFIEVLQPALVVQMDVSVGEIGALEPKDLVFVDPRFAVSGYEQYSCEVFWGRQKPSDPIGIFGGHVDSDSSGTFVLTIYNGGDAGTDIDSINVVIVLYPPVDVEEVVPG